MSRKLSPLNIKSISTYRSELMGWAILWIMMLHFTFTQIKPLGFIAQYGFAGVEIFFLVSGLGLFYSLDKDNNPLKFYKKRLFRIFPTYYIIGIFGSIFLYHDNLLDYLFRYTTIGYWTGGKYGDWYIPALLSLYLFAPVFKLLFDKRWFTVLGALSIGCLLIAYYYVDKEHLLDRRFFFLLYRIPAFILGMGCAYWIKHNVSSKYFLFLLIAGIPFFIFLFPKHHEFYNYKYFSLFFLLPLFVFIFVYISKYFRFINPIISTIGNASLEIYLIQGIFFSAIIKGLITPDPLWHDIITIALIILCCILGIFTHWFIDKIGINRLL